MPATQLLASKKVSKGQYLEVLTTNFSIYEHRLSFASPENK